MTITKDHHEGPFIKREGYTAHGDLEYTETLAPAVLPMTAFEFYDIEPLQWVVSLKTRTGAITKGHHYAIRAITSRGVVVLEDEAGKFVPGLWPMDHFARMLRQEGTFEAKLGTTPAPAGQTGGSKPKRGDA